MTGVWIPANETSITYDPYDWRIFDTTITVIGVEHLSNPGQPEYCLLWVHGDDDHAKERIVHCRAFHTSIHHDNAECDDQ